MAHAVEISSEDDVLSVITHGGPKYDGDLFAFDKILELQAGGDPQYVIGNPVGMLLDAAGRVYVADGQNPRVLVFGRDGTPVRVIGGRGQGPGEFQTISSIQFVEGRLIVLDASSRQLQVFDQEGSYVERIPFPEIPIGRWILSKPDLWMSAPGDLVLSLIENTDDFANVRSVVAIYKAGRPDAVKIIGEWVRLHETVTGLADGRRVRVRTRIRFAGYPAAAYADNEIYLTNGTLPIVDVYGLDGSLARRIRLAIPPPSISQEDRARVHDALEQHVARALNPPQGTRPRADGVIEARVRRDHPRFADSKAFWVDIYVDDQRFVWLQHPSDDGDGTLPKRPTFWIVSPEGVFLGVAQPPGFTRVMRGYLLSIQTNDDSGEFVPTVYKIRSTIEGLRYIN